MRSGIGALPDRTAALAPPTLGEFLR
jgi:hypothetical protein